MSYDETEDLLLPDPEAYKAMREARLKQQQEEREATKEWSIIEVKQTIRQAVNNGYFSYRDLADILNELYDEEERAALKTLL